MSAGVAFNDCASTILNCDDTQPRSMTQNFDLPSEHDSWGGFPRRPVFYAYKMKNLKMN